VLKTASANVKFNEIKSSMNALTMQLSSLAIYKRFFNNNNYYAVQSRAAYCILSSFHCSLEYCMQLKLDCTACCIGLQVAAAAKATSFISLLNTSLYYAPQPQSHSNSDENPGTT
jgi:hypothetical protein